MVLVPLALRRDPVEVLLALAAHEPGAFSLDVPDPRHPVTLLGCAPTDELVVDAATPDALGAIARFVAESPAGDPTLPFPLAGGVFGYLAYELGARLARPALERLPVEPLAVLRRYDPMLVHDRTRRQYSLLRLDERRPVPSWVERLSATVKLPSGPLASAPLAPALPADVYLARVRRILDYLAAGDAYQINFTQPFSAPLVAPAWVLFAWLARRHPAPFAAYLDLGDRQIVCNSPELLLRRRGTRVETRPIKGTRARDGDDAAALASLRRDPKDAAEHVMIVDLERNDLGRVCRPGSVRVEAFARAESQPSVHHLVSVVAGTTRDDVDLAALLAATFPGGSITGAPKVRAMEIIAELEDHPRGVYTGALGLVHPAGDLELALPIRTAVVEGGQLRWPAGGGIVIDSDPARELDEAWVKTAAVRAALDEPELAWRSSG
jgi:para-aminobenzoate synthetase component 1